VLIREFPPLNYVPIHTTRVPLLILLCKVDIFNINSIDELHGQASLWYSLSCSPYGQAMLLKSGDSLRNHETLQHRVHSIHMTNRRVSMELLLP
jgi:hypothetical protein